MKFTHAADNRLAGLVVALHREGGVFLGQFGEGDAQLVKILLGLGLYGDTDHGIRELHGFQGDGLLLQAHGVTGAEVFETDSGADVSRLHEIDGILVVGVHLVQTGYALLLAGAGVVHVRTCVQAAGIGAEEGKTADERIRGNLEHQRAERLLGGGLAGDFLSGTGMGSLDGSLVQRRRQIPHHGIQEELHALVLEGRTAAGRDNLHGDGALADSGDDFVLGEGVGILEILLHQGLIALGAGFQKDVPPAGGFALEVCGNLAFLVVDEFLGIAIVVDGLHVDEVHDAFELVFGTDGETDGNGRGAQFGLDFLHTGKEIGADAVHLVHIRDLRHAVLVCLAPDSLALRLYAADRAESSHRTIQYAQAAFYFHGEIHVSGSVNQVNLVGITIVVPEGGGGSRSDGNTPLLLLDHPVHRGGTFVNLTDLVCLAGVVQNAFRCGGLTGIDVGHDADVACVFKISLCHLACRIRNGSVQMPCWPLPFCAYLPCA